MSCTLRPSTSKPVSAGSSWPLGATVRDGGVNFALYSRNAEEVFLLLFDRPDGEPSDVIRLEERTRFIWHAFVERVRPGQLYGYRVRGPWDPPRGLRFNEHKLLLDPYAKALTGKPRNQENLLLAYDLAAPEPDLVMDRRDSASSLPKCVVVDDAFDWQDDAPPGLPLESLILYEVHVKGFTAHPSSGVDRPGTYLGFAEKIPYLKKLGISAVELLPVHEHYVEDFLRDRGLANFWGYNTVTFFAAESTYGSRTAPGCEVREFKTMVRELHRAGIEVILDVVYNHTAEGNEKGPTLSLRGIDNPSYYCLTGPPEAPGRLYQNYTGCGNCLNLASPPAIRLVMDSLRYWVETMHVDGFRFDLASVLGREDGRFRTGSSFFDAVSQDPVLARVKLIAEPWDLGTYQAGNFPVDWSEWNGRFRDTVRKFLKGDAGQLRDLGWRITGSADLYGDDGRSAYNSINFVTCHDGFTLRDLVSYDGKHNEANLESNRDGTDDNNSWNCGVEGETDDPDVRRLRRRMAKNLMCGLLFSCGTPMLLGGDEFLRTQRGNNNAYCQDNELSWLDWRDAAKNADFLEFARKAIAFTRRYPVLQRRKFLLGRDLDADGLPDIDWLGCDGGAPAWGDPERRTIGYRLASGRRDDRPGEELLCFLLNADWRLRFLRLPEAGNGRRWHRVVDTSLAPPEDFIEEARAVPLDPEDHYLVNPRTTVVLLAR
ncbi:MAG: glycogen debranching protein GlgX [Acidobacteriia bacterium]|nr:glycogen debranching protein GlgX [Terriglobia bacterium]